MQRMRPAAITRGFGQVDRTSSRLGALGVIFLIAAVSCARPPTNGANTESAAASACSRPSEWSEQSKVETLGPVRLEPPPENATARYSYNEAFDHTATDTPCGKGPPEVRLALFSNDSYGQVQPDDTVTHPYQDVLAWAMIWHEQECLVLGPGPMPQPALKIGASPSVVQQPVAKPSNLTCDQISFVDANTNKEIMTIQFQTGTQ